MSNLSKLSDAELLALLDEPAPTPAAAPVPEKEPIGFLESIPLGFKKSALGTIQTGLDIAEPVAEFLGAKDTTKAIKEAKKSGFDVEQQYREKGEGSGVSGFLGEAIGGAISPAGVAALATAPASGPLGLAWQGAKLGAVSGATAPLEEGQSRAASGAIGAGIGAVLTPLTAKGVQSLVKKANKSFNALIGKSPVIKSADELKALAEPLYAIKEAASQTALKPAAYGQAGLKLEKIATPKGFAREQAQKSGKDAVYNFYKENILPLAKRNITLDDFDVVDGAFQRAIDDVAPNSLLGKSGDKDAGRRLMQMRQIFHDTIQSAPDDAFIGGKAGAIAWRQADRIKAAEYATRDLDALIQKSMDKDQPAKAIQTGLAQILNSPRYSKAFNAKEKELMRSAIKTGVIGEGLRAMGSRLGVLGVALTGGLEAGAAAVAGGALTREAAEAARVKGIDTVKQAITSRAIGTPMPVMPNVGATAGSIAGKIATVGAAQGIAGERGVPQESIGTGLESLGDEELLKLLNEDEGNPTRITINPAAEGTEGVPDVQLPDQSMTQQNEGLRLSTYTDTEGNPTIGYGFNFNSGIAPKVWKTAGLAKDMKAVKAGRESLEPAEAQALFQASYQVADNDARQYYKDFDSLTPVQQEALRDMSYQFGLPNLQKMKSLHSALQKGDKNAIVQAIRNSDYGRKFEDRAREVTNMLISEQAYAQDLTPQQRGFLKAKGLL
jgi:GH24 family phage-related lysozyme (muramidase)